MCRPEYLRRTALQAILQVLPMIDACRYGFASDHAWSHAALRPWFSVSDR